MPPIKRSEYLKPLSREHHFSLLFGWKIKQGINRSVAIKRMTDYVAYFWPKMLLPHFKEEEESLFNYSTAEPTQQALEEHQRIEQMIRILIDEPEKASYTALLSLAEAVDLHVRFEERTLFPFLENELTEEQLITAGKAIADSPPVSDDYEDHFWEVPG